MRSARERTHGFALRAMLMVNIPAGFTVKFVHALGWVQGSPR
jgi:hypothetical protein